MEELKKSIEQKEKELAKAKAERQAAKVEEFAALDRNILMLELQIKQLEESQRIQELREKGGGGDKFTVVDETEVQFYLPDNGRDGKDDGEQ